MKDANQRLAWALEACAAHQMRLTPVRATILRQLADRQAPLSLEDLAQGENVRGACDAATVYRTLMVLRELEVIRQVSLPNKISYYVLNIPGESTHYLVCGCCGELKVLLSSACEHTLEHEVAAEHGYARLRHESLFVGTCPACQKHSADVVCAKVQPRMRPNLKIRTRFVANGCDGKTFPQNRPLDGAGLNSRQN
jgi:Fe2+ or Zn2+ uptake regulation protein